MAKISTDGRIFVAQLTRDLAHRERAGAAALTPGSTTWVDAFDAFGQTLIKTGSPVKKAAIIRAAYQRLVPIHNQHTCTVHYFHGRSRTGTFEVFTFEVAKHPLTGDGNAGIVVQNYFFHMRRNGSLFGGFRTVAFVSWHALARMYERSEVDMFEANGVVAGCGLVGYLMGESRKHINTEINFAFANMLCTGVLRSATNKKTDQYYEFFDVLTVLPLDEALPHKRGQGQRIYETALKYVRSKSIDPRGLADAIPVLPFRADDFISRQISPPA